jgi:glycosyltransferase involved in cell wall biosynthesis
MKVTFITGSYPPAVCGVGDYTHRLVEALALLGIRSEVVHDEDWGLLNVARAVKRVKSLHSDIVHIQYPTIGFGTHLSPQIISLMIPCVVTLHEFSQAHMLRQLALYPFFLRARRLIFTSVFEQKYAIAKAPWLRNRTCVAPLGVSLSVGDLSRKKDIQDIVYFGIIRPDKGIEDVLKLAKYLRDKSAHYRVRIIGKPHANSIGYYQLMRKRAEDLPVVWNVDLSDNVVSDLLSRAQVAYMPFPDGASERRTSLFALLANGVATVTTRGDSTPEDMLQAAVFVQKPEQALAEIMRILADHGRRNELSHHAWSYMKNRSWETIALRHQEIYADILASRRAV